jgi:hypothetical protein
MYEVQRCTTGFETVSLTCLIISQLCDKFETEEGRMCTTRVPDVISYLMVEALGKCYRFLRSSLESLLSLSFLECCL